MRFVGKLLYPILAPITDPTIHALVSASAPHAIIYYINSI